VSAEQAQLSGPDLLEGIPFDSIPDGGIVGGHANGQAVVVSRHGNDVFAIGGQCTHYGGPLAEGLVVGNTIRCPWHHACFDLRTGEALAAPALNHVARWEIVRDGNTIKVAKEIAAPDGATSLDDRKSPDEPGSIIIVGAGAAGNAAAEMLRRENFRGKITMIGGDESVPYDRPNLSKDYLAGNAPEEWIPLRTPEFYEEHDIELLRGVTVTAVEADKKIVRLSTGETKAYDRLLLSTGAEPVRLPIPGSDLAHVHYLRTLADSRSIIEAAKRAKQAVVIGSSFIGLEVTASLRARGLAVDVVAPEKVPLERVLGDQLGGFVQKKHESEGVVFHLGRKPGEISATAVTLDDGTSLPADLVVVGVGVRPLTSLAEAAGASMDNGVLVDEFLETSLPGIFAAGDIARFPDPRSGQTARIEHWAVAERQGQTAARNMIGAKEKFASVPFFWSAHYQTTITYVGRAERWDEILINGSVDDGDCLVGYKLGGKILAVAALGRDKESLEAEAALERQDWKALDKLFEKGNAA
jgi:NADPH-dependent 2,4-dienoyl-CoA reductase/sulfur reductase-like enzyme/nitrite reductase/ring-hydroxylating ferredoxin subunit